jgi:hypothetical protein
MESQAIFLKTCDREKSRYHTLNDIMYREKGSVTGLQTSHQRQYKPEDNELSL